MPETEFKLARAGDVALLTIDNGEDHTKPTFLGEAALASLDRALTELERGSYEALVITGKPFVFCAGADINQFAGATAELAREGSRVGHELFGRIAALPFPTVAAINGACLGGGVELALHCDARTISSSVRHFACPECFLGIIPAWGGTQLVPRLVGVETAVKFVVANPMRQNRMLKGPEAFELGFADRLFDPVEFLDESLAFATELQQNSTSLEGRVRPSFTNERFRDVFEKARRRLDDQVHGAAPAPYRALDLIEGACSGWSIDEGYLAEEDAVSELLPSRQAQASVYAFDLVERRAKKPPPLAAEPGRVKRVGIVGAGLMATQLATLFLKRFEVPIVIRDLDEEIVERALTAIRSDIAERPRGAFLGSIVTGSTSYEGFADCDLVLEAVVEELPVKQQVFGELRKLTGPDCILATNTSSLSVAEMGADVGLHFFNPVAVLPLVELVRTDETGDVTLATAWDVCQKLRKRPVIVRDAPAFVVNRVLTRMMVAVLDALEHGNTVEETDEAVLRLGLPMAPSILVQLVGPRVALHVLETLHDAYPDRFPLSQTLANYAEGNDEIPVQEHAPRSSDQILESVLEAVADEIRQLLDEGVVPEAKDVDTALLLGAGWPFFLGGITRYLDQTGVSERMFGRPLADVGAGTRA